MILIDKQETTLFKYDLKLASELISQTFLL